MSEVERRAGANALRWQCVGRALGNERPGEARTEGAEGRAVGDGGRGSGTRGQPGPEGGGQERSRVQKGLPGCLGVTALREGKKGRGKMRGGRFHCERGNEDKEAKDTFPSLLRPSHLRAFCLFYSESQTRDLESQFAAVEQLSPRGGLPKLQPFLCL